MLGENPKMNMLNFPRDVWILHRKLFHRFLKHRQCFVRATENLEDFTDGDSSGDDASVSSSPFLKKGGLYKKKKDDGFVISLLSSDSEDADDDDDSMG